MSLGWRAGPGMASLCTLVLLLILISGATADAISSSPDPEASPRSVIANGSPDGRHPVSTAVERVATPRARPTHSPRESADFRASAVRTAIAFAGLLVFAWQIRDGYRPGDSRSRTRLVLLGVLALSAYASYYQFFRLGHPDGFATSDNFHYYVGSKYFPELGYYGLYECAMVALEERGVRVPGGASPKARDLRSMKIWPASWVRKKGENCRERFTPERFKNFSRDVAFFIEKWPPHIRNAVFSDHGYHPTPVWTLFGSTVAALAPTDSRPAIRILMRADRVLIAGVFVFVAWAFGLETACLAAILWGTGHLWRYTWVGDAFLRHLWWIAAFLGLGALRRGATSLAGASLAASALFRIFPGAFGFGYVAGLARNALDGRATTRPLIRFTFGAVVASAILVTSSLIAIGQGFTPIAEFATKIGQFAGIAATNKMGLGVVARALFPESSALALGLRIGAGIGFSVLFWRGLRDALPFEAAAFGLTLIPYVTDPTNYYYSFFVMGAVLATRRPLIGLILLGTVVAWGINGMILYHTYAEFLFASVIAVLSTIAIAWTMGTPPWKPRDEAVLPT